MHHMRRMPVTWSRAGGPTPNRTMKSSDKRTCPWKTTFGVLRLRFCPEGDMTRVTEPDGTHGLGRDIKE